MRSNSIPSPVCLFVYLSVPSFVWHLFRTSAKAWMTPGSDQLYSGVQTDAWATILEQKRIPHKIMGSCLQLYFQWNFYLLIKGEFVGLCQLNKNELWNYFRALCIKLEIRTNKRGSCLQLCFQRYLTFIWNNCFEIQQNWLT